MPGGVCRTLSRHDSFSALIFTPLALSLDNIVAPDWIDTRNRWSRPHSACLRLRIMGTYTPGEFRSAIGIYFMAWMMVTIFLGGHITWILFFVFLTFTHLMGDSNFSTGSGLPKAAGTFGIITSLIAYYHSLAKLLEGDHAPFALPLGRMGAAKQY
ncbi:hypothetical protein C8R45DRAFT_946539 [Mycena sanguinolenta]|nr:hypothetical protein C8R45DRAFT_946539 [Mycena sanguinolenta]